MTDPKIVLEAQQDNKKRESLIEAQLEQIRKSASKTAGYWVDQHDDIYSEAMIAFNDAITAYNPEKGDFTAFSYRVIANRVTDYLRKTNRYRGILPFSTLDESDGEGNVILFDPVDTKTTRGDVKLEIISLKQELEAFGISFFDLPGVSPKSKKTRRECTRVVREIVADVKLLEKLYKTKKLPLSGLSRYSSKLLERHRKYIIAGVLICAGEYPVMAEYFSGGETG